MLDDRIEVILLISNRISKTGGRNPRAAITIHPICAWSQKWTQGDSLLNQLQRWRDARGERGGVDARPGRWLITKIFDLCERSVFRCVRYVRVLHFAYHDKSSFRFWPLEISCPSVRAIVSKERLKRARQRFSGWLG